MLGKLLTNYKESNKSAKDLAKLRDQIELETIKILNHLNVFESYLRKDIINEVIYQFYIYIDTLYNKNLRTYLYTIIIHYLYQYRKKNKGVIKVELDTISDLEDDNSYMDYVNVIEEIISESKDKELYRKVIYSNDNLTTFVEKEGISYYNIKKIQSKIKKDVKKYLI